MSGELVKCVAWDIDNTLLAGVYLESGARPPAADPAMVKLLAELGGRGILHALVSKNPPEAAAHAAQVTGWEFAAVECGWDPKPAALTRIATDLGIGTGALAFVDDDPYERADVAAALPDVLVLSPEEIAQAPGWPEFSPPVVTSEARRRAEMYAARRRRDQARRDFGGSREEFVRSVGTEVTIAPAAVADAARLHELSVRTHQFNSTGQELTEQEFASLIAGTGTEVITVRLRDDFGDDGMVGGCLAGWRDGTVTAGLLMMSCRAMGRGVIGVLLAWLMRSAARRGAQVLEIPCVLTERNVPLRLALAAAGLRAGTGPPARTGPAAAGPVLFRRELSAALAPLPPWVSQAPAVAAELRQLIAAITGRPELAAITGDTPLLRAGAALGSLAGTRLLREIHRRYGVDVAGEDLNLDALATLGSLAAFVAARSR